MVKISAPGKIHIIGEHSVVYGFPAIISAIAQRTRVKAERAEKIKIKNNLYQKEVVFEIAAATAAAKKSRQLWKEGNEKNDFSCLFSFLRSDFWKRNQAMLGLIFERLKVVKGGVSLIIDSDLPPGVGLGSSASLSVAITKAIAALYVPQIPNQKINEIAFELEKLNHGRPSGGDNSSSTFGGTIWFEKGKVVPVSLPDFLQNLIIVLTARRNLSTGDLVQKVRNLEKNFRGQKIKNIAEATYKMRRALDEKDVNKVKNLINFAQDNLTELGISSPEIDGLVKEVRKIGGAAKISGGGGGTVICFHRDKARLIKLLKKLKVNFEEIKLGAEGVKVES
ncbi:mevalonate kinase [Patescibacteria group bacterium]|nr:mevalonate kinase [Patescibacteria group bacterium]MBU4481124.1 mevalonate kinase [Patescibacteria group bacterium]